MIYDSVKITAQLSDLKQTFKTCEDQFKNKVYFKHHIKLQMPLP